MLSRKLLVSGCVAAAGALGLAACSSSPSSSSTTTTSATTSSTAAASNAPPTSALSLSETGSTLLYPLFQAWAAAYHTAYPNITVTPAGTGSGTGISQAAAGTVDIGASDAYLSPADFSKYPTLENIPVAISAQQINYNVSGVTANIKLTGAVIAQIYTGKITKWNDTAITTLNPGVNLPDLTIVPVHRADSSGDTFLFTSFLAKSASSAWTVQPNTTVSWPSVPGEVAATGNGGMVTECKATPGCIAYIGISYLSKTQAAGLGEAALANQAGNYELPTATSITAAAGSFAAQTPANAAISMIFGPASDGYPIVNYEYAIVRTDQSSTTTGQGIRALLTWAINPSNGAAAMYLDPVHFQPLPSAVATISSALIAKVQ